MPEVVATPETAAPPQPPLGAAPVEPPAATAPPAPPAPAEPKSTTVPTSTFKKLKEEAYARGQQEAREHMAKEAGFSTYEEMQEALKGLRAPSTAPAPAAPAVPAQGEPATAAERERLRKEGKDLRQLERTITERDRYARLYGDASREAKSAKAAVDELRAEMHLRTLAAQSGIKEIDFAMHLFSKTVDGLKPEEAEKFNESEYFLGLRKSHPYLFGETVQPATTGTGAGAPAAPAPGAAAGGAAAGAKTDARTMSREEFQKLLRSRGLNLGA